MHPNLGYLLFCLVHCSSKHQATTIATTSRSLIVAYILTMQITINSKRLFSEWNGGRDFLRNLDTSSLHHVRIKEAEVVKHLM